MIINTRVTIYLAVWFDLLCRIPNHSSTILKCLLKLLVDVTDSSAHLTTEGLFAQLLLVDSLRNILYEKLVIHTCQNGYGY